jgi:DNA-binding MarR family transcriptional regulator
VTRPRVGRRGPQPLDHDGEGPDQHTGWLLKQAVIYTGRVVDDVVRDHGVSVAQWAVLRRLADYPGLSGAELARMMLVSPQATQQALTTLDQMGLVERKPDPNHGRIIRAFLTVDGRRVADLCWADALQIERDLLAIFTAQEQRTFTDLLLRYVGQFDSTDATSPGGDPDPGEMLDAPPAPRKPTVAAAASRRKAGAPTSPSSERPRRR